MSLFCWKLTIKPSLLWTKFLSGFRSFWYGPTVCTIPICTICKIDMNGVIVMNIINSILVAVLPSNDKFDGESSSQVQIYVQSCKKLGIVPVSYICRKLLSKSIVCRSHELGPKGAKAIAISMVVSLILNIFEILPIQLLNITIPLLLFNDITFSKYLISHYFLLWNWLCRTMARLKRLTSQIMISGIQES